jgi:uncharacterized membrane protein YhaH (DUF805 family)
MDLAHLIFGLGGRINRKRYWIASGVLLVASVIAVVIEYSLPSRWPAIVLYFALLYPNFAVALKRAYDRDMSPVLPMVTVVVFVFAYVVEFFGLAGTNDDPNSTLLLLIWVPLLAIVIYLFVVLGFLKGTRGPNRYGPDPLEAHI